MIFGDIAGVARVLTSMASTTYLYLKEITLKIEITHQFHSVADFHFRINRPNHGLLVGLPFAQTLEHALLAVVSGCTMATPTVSVICKTRYPHLSTRFARGIEISTGKGEIQDEVDAAAADRDSQFIQWGVVPRLVLKKESVFPSWFPRLSRDSRVKISHTYLTFILETRP